jgi:hypothetical protein
MGYEEDIPKVSGLAKLLQEKLGEMNICCGDSYAKELANACFDYMLPKIETQITISGSFETIRD